MNRILAYDAPQTRDSNAVSPRRSHQSVAETKKMLREIAFVLAMTRRVKAEILEEQEQLDPATV
jgi:adenylate kinase